MAMEVKKGLAEFVCLFVLEVEGVEWWSVGMCGSCLRVRHC